MKTVKIKDLGRTVTGHTPPTSESKYYGDYMPFVKPTDIDKESKYTYNPEQYYSREAADKYKTSLIPKGSTCVVCIGTIGEKMTMAHCDLYTNQSINSIIPSKDYDPDYVYYLLKYNLGKVKALNKGTASGREFVSKSTFLEMDVNVHPDKDDQHKVATVLSRYDELIENKRKQITLLEEAISRIFTTWFIDLRFPNHESVQYVDNLPIGWERKSVSELGEYLNGFAFKPSDWQKEGAPIIKIKEMGNGVTKDTPKNTGERVPIKYRVKPGDILFSWSATLMVIVWAGEEGWLNQHLFKVTPEKGIGREFLLQSLSHTIDEFSNLTTGSTMKHIQRNKLDQVFVNVPNKELMTLFSDNTEKMREEILNINTQIRLLIEARDILIEKLMTGSISI